MTVVERVPIEDEVGRRGLKLRRVGHELVGPCPRCGGTDRFSINPRKQVFNCRGFGGGDVVSLVQHLDGCDFRAAIQTLGMEERRTTAARPAPAPEPAQPHEDALSLWRAAVPIAGTTAEKYLRSRGLIFEDQHGDVLRFHRSCPFGSNQRHPCMLALFTTIVGNTPIGIHRTALTPDGHKIERKNWGPCAGAAIKLSADEDVEAGLHIGEGIETTLAAMMLGFRPAWALGSAGAIAKFPVLSGIDALTAIVDHDKPDAQGRQAGHAAARACAERWIEAGREVRSVIPRAEGADMADLIVGQVHGG